MAVKDSPRAPLGIPFFRRFLVAAVLIPAANGSFATNANEKLTYLDQATVTADSPLSDLRKALVDAEDRFYQEYNEINTRDDFDVNCEKVARTGSRLVLRICRAVYQEEAIRVSSKEGLETTQRFQDETRNGRGVMPWSPPVTAAARIMAIQPEFQRNMAAVVSRSRVLTRLLKERAEAQAALEAAERAARGRGDKEAPAADPSAAPAGEPGASLSPE